MTKQLHGIAKEFMSDLNREVNSYRVRGADSLLFLTCRGVQADARPVIQ